MTFDDAKKFFISWGLRPSEEKDDDFTLGNGDGECQINQHCYERMLKEAEDMFGPTFRAFVSRAIDATDCEFYLSSETWNDVLDLWNRSSI